MKINSMKKLMEDLRFRELYEEAKIHEKHANLTQLTTRAKNDKLSQETNFYLILTGMLAELQENEETEISSSNLDKVYKWYLLNKRTSKKQNQKPVKLNSTSNHTEDNSRTEASSRTEANNEPISLANKGNQYNSSRLGTMHHDEQNTNLINSKNILNNSSSIIGQTGNNMLSSRKQSRVISPVHFPVVNKNSSATPAPRPTSILGKDNKFLKTINSSQPNEQSEKSQKLPDIVAKEYDRDSQNLSRLSETILNSSKENYANKSYEEKKKELNDKTRIGILKALSNYADKLYSELDKRDTKKLETNLKSLSRFYYVFNESENLREMNKINEADKYALVKAPLAQLTPLTLSNLVDMAKDVSDRMIISKAEASIRHSQNKLWFESSKRNHDSSKPAIEDSNKGVSKEMINSMLKSSDDTLKLPVYSVVIRKSAKRPKSSTASDWRGLISRPNTARSRNRAMPSQTTRSKSTPHSKIRVHSATSDYTENSKNNFGYSKDKFHKSKRSAFKSSKISRSMESMMSSESKEVKFMNFIKKIDDSGMETAKLKAENDVSGKSSRLDKKSEKSSESFVVVPTQNIESKTPNEAASTPKIVSLTQEIVSKEVTQASINHQDIEMLKCLHNEIIKCECCINTEKSEIFHLTATNEENPIKMYLNDERTTNTAVEPEPKTDLREILLNNYDPKFAAKIGIKDFLPIEVMNNHLDEDSKPLEFIPFENIDQSYPKVRGQHVFDPNYNKPIKRLYRTNPSIPRPESKYGTRSDVYEQILSYKKQNLDSNALVVWQPEDVILVRDLLEMEHEPLTELLKVEPYRLTKDNGMETDTTKNTELVKMNINVNITANGRPINSQPHVRWKSIEATQPRDDKTDLVSVDSYYNTDEKHFNSYENSKVAFTARDSIPQDVDPSKPNVIRFRLKGSAVSAHRNLANIFSEDHAMNKGTPIENYNNQEDAKDNTYNEAKKSVHIPSIFKGTTIQNYVKEFNLEERARKERQRLAAIKIQQSFRAHIRNKRFIEQSSAVTSETRERVRNHKLDIDRRQYEKNIALKQHEQMLNKENLKLKTTLKHIGMHVDLYEVLHQKGPEYTNKILNKAATCIQRWVRGWLIRKELKKFQELIINDSITTWSAFLKHYRRTLKRILIIRGDHKTKFNFKIKELVDFYMKEKKYNSYYDKLAFMDHIDLNDLEKMFNYADLYPSTSELKEAKENVLKFYKKKSTITTFHRSLILDMIYYIYPPLGTKLKSTRKSTWQNPRVGDEDALRLRGFKFIEKPNFEATWQLVAQATINHEQNESQKN